MTDEPMVQVLGAIAYGEQRAHDGAKARAEAATTDEERRAWRTVAAQELRHHKGFVARLQAMGADAEAAMAAAKPVLDAYDERPPATEIEDAVWGFLGEGIADDLMAWFRDVVDDDLRAFVETVLADEAEHEALAAAELRSMLDAEPGRRDAAQDAAEAMVRNMLGTGGVEHPSMLAFLAVGRADELLRTIMGGFARRLGELDLDADRVAQVAIAGFAGGSASE